MTASLLRQRPPRSATAVPAARLIATRKVYGAGAAEVVALDGVDLDVHAGELTAVMGPSGSGKSTLMHCLAGLDRPTTGSVLIDDVDLTALDDRAVTLLRRERIGFVFQAFNLIPSLTALENILLPLSLSGTDVRSEVLDDVVTVLGLEGRLDHRPSELSGGQQQRVAVARALVAEPAIVFADEPTGNLDTATGNEILGFLRRAVDERSQTTVMVTHDPGAAAWADRVVFIVDGRVHDELRSPSADAVLEIMKGLGR
ncbi:MAG: ABC transporter ATP-binding protein [Actinomycetota bacterium]